MTSENDRTPGRRVALVTGANTGIGRVTARELAKRGAHVFLACRSLARAQPAADEIRASGGTASVVELDLGDLDSVRRCAATVLAHDLPLHILINNAGVAGSPGLTTSGFERTFGVNHVGPFLLTALLLDRLRASAPARIVIVASRAHYRATGIDWTAVHQPTKSRTGLAEYATSKLANVLFSAELGRRLSGTGVNTYSLHPGVVASDIWRAVPWPLRPLMKLTMISNEEGAATSLHCATSPAAATESGLYYDTCRVTEPGAAAQSLALAAELWARSEDWVR
jgi:NAD(P)-dependent dehydrogenase (short-subunit alcohol dehydrogenase family)